MSKFIANDNSRRILLPVVNMREAQSLMPIAKALVEAGASHVVLAGLVTLAEDQPLSKGAYRARRRRLNLMKLLERWSDWPVKIDTHVRVAHDPVNELNDLVAEHECGVVLLRLAPDGPRALGWHVEELLSRLTCTAILLRGIVPLKPEQVLLTIHDIGERVPLATWVATALAEMYQSEFRTMRLRSPTRAFQTRNNEDPYLDLLDEIPYERDISLRGSLMDLIEALQREVRKNHIVVLSIGGRPKAVRGRLGTRTRAIMDSLTVPTITVHAPTEMDKLARPREAWPFPIRVDKWFAENTFDAEEFSDLERLVALKQAQGLTISLGLPALNEEETVGNVIRTIRDALMDKHPLLDEIVLIDSMSTDRTVAIAESLGVPVYRHPQILPEMGSYPGKGEALWKSLFVMQGDIVAWVDTDIVNIHPRFVYGLLGPLLVSPRLHYVKRFYKRPLYVGNTIQAGGGGRVTELVVRPLFNQYFPELSGVVQPLSGEYAGRRWVLERVPFFSTYAVETGLLIDIWAQNGLPAIAQVDLKERIHHNQPLEDLSRMSFVIFQAFFDRLDEHGILDLRNAPSNSMKLPVDDEGRLFLGIDELETVERPPLLTIPAYKEMREQLVRRQDAPSVSPLFTDEKWVPS
jgi:glucosyl-3-phosphoglycerate synthase